MGRSLRVVLVDWDALARARADASGELDVPEALCTEYPPLSYIGAGKDLLWVSLIWDSLRDELEPGDRERFDGFFRRIGWNPDSYANDNPYVHPAQDGDDGRGLYHDVWVFFDTAPPLALSPTTIAMLLAWWRDFLGQEWETTLRPHFDPNYTHRFPDFDAFTAFIVRWIDAFEAATRAGRGILGAYS